MFIASFILLLVIFFLIKLFFDGNNKIREFATRVPGPPLYPIIGNMLLFIGSELSFSELMQKNYEKYGERFRFVVGNKAVLVTSNTQDIEAIVSSTSTKADLYQLLKYFLGDSVVLNTGEEAKKKRRILTPTFHVTVLDTYFPIIDVALKRLLKKLDGARGEFVEITHLIQCFTIDLLTETTMGAQVNALENWDSEYVTAFRTILDCYDSKWMNILYHSDFIYKRTAMRKIEKNAVDKMAAFCEKIIAERRKAVENDEVFVEGKKVSFLDALLVLKDENGYKMDDEAIKYEVHGVMIAGHDTSYSTFSILAYILSTQPELQDKIYREQLEIMGDDKSKTPSLEDTHKMKYLDMTIRETLRLYSTIPTIGRKAITDIQLDGVIVPQGTDVYINIMSMGRNEKIFPDPLKFDPERWSPENSTKRSKYAHIPFSIGPRNCLGQSFAMWELKSLMSQISRNFKILPPEKEMEIHYSLAIKPKGGMKLKFTKRDQLLVTKNIQT